MIPIWLRSSSISLWRVQRSNELLATSIGWRGLLWIGTMMAQIWAKGFQPHIIRRLLCLSIFWHALDIIWVAIFTIVYLVPN